MDVVIDAELKLPAINNKYCISRFSRQLVLSSDYRAGKDALSISCRNLLITTPYGIKIEVETYKDIDSCVKAVIDVVSEKIGMNDKDCLELVVSKKRRKRGSIDKIKVSVWGITDEAAKQGNK